MVVLGALRLGVVKLVPLVTCVVRPESEYHLSVPPLPLADRPTVPLPQRLLLVVPGAAGIVLTVAVTVAVGLTQPAALVSVT